LARESHLSEVGKNWLPCRASNRSPSHQEKVYSFELNMGERLGEDVSPIVIGMNFDNLDCPIEDLITKMMISDGKMLSTRAIRSMVAILRSFDSHHRPWILRCWNFY